LARKNIFKPTIGNESLHQDSNDNGVRVVKLDLVLQNTMSQTFTNTSGSLLTTRLTVKLIMHGQKGDDIQVSSMYDPSGKPTVITDHYLVIAKVRERLPARK
jgi:hypothetical protein